MKKEKEYFSRWRNVNPTKIILHSHPKMNIIVMLLENMSLTLLVVFLFVLFIYHGYRKHVSRCRLTAVRNRPVSDVPDRKVIIALEIEGIIADISYQKRQGYSKVELGEKGVYKLVSQVKESLGMGVYYKPKATSRMLSHLLSKLTSQPNV